MMTHGATIYVRWPKRVLWKEKTDSAILMHHGVLQVYQGVCCCLHCKRQDIIPIPRAENYNCVWFTHGCSWEIAISPQQVAKKGKKDLEMHLQKAFLTRPWWALSTATIHKKSFSSSCLQVHHLLSFLFAKFFQKNLCLKWYESLIWKSW